MRSRSFWSGLLLCAGATVFVGCPDKPPPSDVPTDMPTNDMGMNDTGSTDSGSTDGGSTDSGMTDTDAGTDTPDVPVMPAGPRTWSTNGSAAVLASNDAFALVTNRTAGTIAVVRTNFSGATPSGTTDTGSPLAIPGIADGEPWAAVLSNDNNTGYVILRKAQKVIRINNLRTTPTVDTAMVDTGSEPTGIAISPNGTRLYVANWAEGSVSVIDAAAFTALSKIDLNDAVKGYQGLTAARPGLAHPRAITVTNNGNNQDDDETVYVTEFFSQTRSTGVPTDDSKFDLNRVGLVYRFSTSGTPATAVIPIQPTADTGFQDTGSNPTGCFPNQLYAATLNSGRLYVTGVCESPRGPTGPVCPPGQTCTCATGMAGCTPPNAFDVRNFKTQIHSVVYAINTATNTETPSQHVFMNRQWEQLYGMRGTADDGTRRMPLIPNDISFVNNTTIAYVTAYGSDAVFRLVYAADGSLVEVGPGATGANLFINLASTTPAGRLPIGIATSNNGSPAGIVINENTRNFSILSFAMQAPVQAAATAPAPAAGSTAEKVNLGRRFFVTGLGRWSLRGQGWNSCEACHPDGLTDNVTWYFARGPRQTTSLDGSYGPTGERRIFNWTAIFDEVQDFELNTRGNSGGVGAIVHVTNNPANGNDRIIFDGTVPTGTQVGTAANHAGLNGATAAVIAAPGVPRAAPATTNVNASLTDWTEIDEYVKVIRTPRRPRNFTTQDEMDAMAGKTTFEQNGCAACHGGSNWTISKVFWTPGTAANGDTAMAMAGTLRTTNYTIPGGYPAALNPPAMAGATSLRFPAGATAAANDQIQCILRAVGTMPATAGADSVVVAGSPYVSKEVRADMTTAAQGATGFNPPSLLGMVTGAPYFHAGNARSLEEAFSTTFDTHARAHGANLFVGLNQAQRDQKVRELVRFLIAIDEDSTATNPFAAPITPTAGIPALCPNTL